MGEIDESEWDEADYSTRIFYDFDTINRVASDAADYSWAMRVASQWLKRHKIGLVQAARNEDDDAWLTLCFVDDE